MPLYASAVMWSFDDGQISLLFTDVGMAIMLLICKSLSTHKHSVYSSGACWTSTRAVSFQTCSCVISI